MIFRIYRLAPGSPPDTPKGEPVLETTRPADVSAYVREHNGDHWHTPAILIESDYGRLGGCDRHTGEQWLDDNLEAHWETRLKRESEFRTYLTESGLLS